MKLDRIIGRLMPPALAWRLGRAARERRELETFAGFYRAFVREGDLCFDIGANLGNRTRCFRHLGCRVVAVEPQASCFRQLQRSYGKDHDTHLIHQALGRTGGTATMRVSRDHVLTSLSDAFIERTSASGRFANSSWDRTETVAVTTLDELIVRFGEPRFIKIDVEGAELLVLMGAEKIMAERRPPIILAAHPTWLPDGATPERLIQLLHDRGYEIFDTGGKNVRTLAFEDYLCLPQ